MFIQMVARKYNQQQRAEQVRETRRKIVQATMELHETLGPANTSIKAVADRAGVQRLTVYRHFPDETSLFQACTSHWLELNPPPDMATWAQTEPAEARSKEAFLSFYRYYRGTRDMWEVTYRDVGRVEALQGPLSGFEAYLDNVRDDLLQAWRPPRSAKEQVSAVLRHALRFSTWQSLNLEKLGDAKKADLVAVWLRCCLAL